MVFFHSKNLGKRISIGIASLSPGLGATHLCIALANYLASKKGTKTACLELGQSNTFDQLKKNCMPAIFPVKESAHRYFRIYDVDYYPNVKKDEIPVLTNAGYEVLIFDFGVLTDDFMDEFYRCDRKLLLTSAACWRREEPFAFFTACPQIKNLEYLFFMILYGTQSDLHKLAKMYSLPQKQLRAVPFLRNPFHIEKDQFSFFEELL